MYRSRRIVDWPILALDAALLLAIPLALAAIHVGGSHSLHQLLTFDSEQATLLSWVGHWTVHYSTGLLLNNLLGYGLAVGVGYGLAWTMAERWWFRLSLVAILLVVPAVASFASDLAFGHLSPGLIYTSRGASAVVAGLLGLLAVLFLGRLKRQFDTRGAIVGGGVLFVGVLTGLLARNGSATAAEIGSIIGFLSLIMGLDLGLRVRDWEHEDLAPSAHLDWRALGRTALVGTVVFAVLLLSTIALFPANPFSGAQITNIFGHATGFLLGTGIALWGHRYWTAESWLHHSRN